MRKTFAGFGSACSLLLLIFAVRLRVPAQDVPAETATKQPPEPRIYRDKVEPHWFAENRFWYRVNLPDGRSQFIVVDALEGTRQPAFDHQRLAKVISEKTGQKIEAERLPFEMLKFSEDGKSVQLVGDKAGWKLDLTSFDLLEEKALRPEQGENPPREQRRRGASRGQTSNKSPDGKWEIVVKGDNLFLRDLKDETEAALSYDGNPNNSYERSAQRERTVEMRYDAQNPKHPTPEIYWAPDSRRFVAMRTLPGTERLVYLIESSPKDQVQPHLESYPYLKPGDEIPIRKPHLFDVPARREIPLDDALFANPWSIEDLRWASNSLSFTFLYNQRGHQVLRVVGVGLDPGAGSGIPANNTEKTTASTLTLRSGGEAGAGIPRTTLRAVVEERSDTFVCYSGKFFCEYLDDSGEIIWMSERDGWNHLYLYDAKMGEVKNQITKGEWVVRGVEKVDREKRQIWFRAGGLRAGEDPYFVHYARINFDGTGLIVLTEGNGTHTARFSPERRFFVDTWSRVDLAPVTELRRGEDGKLICRLEQADTSELSARGWEAPEAFVAKGRDGSTDIYGVIWRPRQPDPAKKYPVIESIYAGPQDSFVPKAFRAVYPQEKLTRRGFVVVQMDGMGTANRSKKFHDVCWKNLGDAGLPDHIAWIKAAGAKYPYLDLGRLGIYGTSAGGQSALGALLQHPDFYKAGVADCGCHDNRMDKIWWNEQWMGWPVGSHYEQQSNVTLASHLQGKLLLMVGELDKNVDPASTMQVVNALVKADKDFEMFVMPGAGHGVARTPYGWRRLEDFFVRHLLGSGLSSGTAATARLAP